MHQSIHILGNLGKDPETRQTPSGEQVVSLNVATNRKYSDSSGQVVKETTWFRVSVWGKQSSACATYLKKGSMVYIEGRLTPDKQSGGPRVFQRPDGTYGSSYEVTANVVKFLSSKDDSQQGQQQSEEEEVAF